MTTKKSYWTKGRVRSILDLVPTQAYVLLNLNSIFVLLLCLEQKQITDQVWISTVWWDLFFYTRWKLITNSLYYSNECGQWVHRRTVSLQGVCDCPWASVTEWRRATLCGHSVSACPWLNERVGSTFRLKTESLCSRLLINRWTTFVES